MSLGFGLSKVGIQVKVALIHDWLIYMRGAEWVLEALCELYPEADLYTLFHEPGTVSPTIENRRIVTSMLQRFPFVQTRYRYYLPLFPLAIERLDLRAYDLVISSSHCVAKGVITAPETCHISYLHTPMLYVWEDFHHYFGRGARPPGIASLIAHYLKVWDVVSADRVDYLITISRYLAARIRKRYRREATIIHPPVSAAFYQPSDRPGEFFLLASALVPRKRVDLAIEAFNRLGLPLKIAGRGWGEEERRLRKMAGRNIEFLGWLDREELRECYRRCRAFILPEAEDFGIAALEAQACGRPVIAFAKGAALETVIPLNGHEAGRSTPGSPTGLFFHEQTVEALVRAIRRFESQEAAFEPRRIRAHSLRFDKEVFKGQMKRFVEEKLAEWAACAGEERGMS